MANIILKNIEKIYPNGFKAIHNLNLDIKDGEFIVLIGPSGCAKSTTLRIIAGLEKSTNGEIWIRNKLVNNFLPKDRNIAMVSQNYALYPHMTIYENIAFGLKIAKISKKEIDNKVKNIAEKLEISNLLDRKPNEISGGQKQRVALGRAIIRKPDVFLFDEPLSNLDAKLKVSMRTKLIELHKELKQEGQSSTMIYVTHDQVEAMTMGDRICVLNNGKIMQIDIPLNIYHKPKNKFVAEFIGSPSMNFITGILKKDKENIIFNFGNNNFLILNKEIEENIKNYINKKIILGIRPENIIPNTEYSKNSFKEKINIIEYTGKENYLHFTIDNIKFISRTDKENLSLKNNLFFYFDINKIYFFDIDTEENIIK